jgi:hypothetical protein
MHETRSGGVVTDKIQDPIIPGHEKKPYGQKKQCYKKEGITKDTADDVSASGEQNSPEEKLRKQNNESNSGRD